MEDELRTHLLRVTEAYAAGRSHALSTAAKAAFGDDRFFTRLFGGATFTVRKYDQALAWFSAHWPPGAVWPEGVARPQAPDDAAPEASPSAPPVCRPAGSSGVVTAHVFSPEPVGGAS